MYIVDVKCNGNWHKHSEHKGFKAACDQADMVHGRVRGSWVAIVHSWNFSRHRSEKAAKRALRSMIRNFRQCYPDYTLPVHGIMLD